MKYLKNVLSNKVVSQRSPIPGSTQVRNSAGGYAWPVDDWVRLERFLILGSQGGSYYASQRKLTLENADAVVRCIQSDGVRAVQRIAEISDSGRAPKNDPAIFALALAAAKGSADTRRDALAALPRVCRTGTHLFHFAEYVDGFRGWGRGLRSGVAGWYNGTPAERLAYQAVKYQSRDGWSHRDLLRLAHPSPATDSHGAIYKWIVDGWESAGEARAVADPTALIWAMEQAKSVDSAGAMAALIREYRLPREAVPTQWLSEAKVWEALLDEMPMTALIRNLATLTRVGLLADWDVTNRVIDQITDSERLRKARVHPISVLAALKTYEQGRGERGKNTWTPVSRIVDALNDAFYASFGSVQSTGKRWVLALDVSGSMSCGRIAGVPGLTPRVASAAMALVTAAREPLRQLVAFSDTMVPVTISPGQRLDDVIRQTDRIPFGGTDCALPLIWALDHRFKADLFVILTDSETWFGNQHPALALRQYRDRMGIPARLVVVGMVSNGFSIADPNDAGMLDVVGFDTATPQLMADFAVH